MVVLTWPVACAGRRGPGPRWLRTAGPRWAAEAPAAPSDPPAPSGGGAGSREFLKLCNSSSGTAFSAAARPSFPGSPWKWRLGGGADRPRKVHGVVPHMRRTSRASTHRLNPPSDLPCGCTEGCHPHSTEQSLSCTEWWSAGLHKPPISVRGGLQALGSGATGAVAPRSEGASAGSSLASIPGGYNTDISRVFNGNNGRSCPQKFPPGLSSD